MFRDRVDVLGQFHDLTLVSLSVFLYYFDHFLDIDDVRLVCTPVFNGFDCLPDLIRGIIILEGRLDRESVNTGVLGEDLINGFWG